MSEQSAFGTYTDYGFAFEHASFTTDGLASGGTFCREMGVNRHIIFYTGSNGLARENNHSIRIDTRITSGSTFLAGVGFGSYVTTGVDETDDPYFYGGLMSSVSVGNSGTPSLPGPERIIVFLASGGSSLSDTPWSRVLSGEGEVNIASFSEPLVPISYDKWYNIRLDVVYSSTTDSAVRVLITDSNDGTVHGSLALPKTTIPATNYSARYPHFLSAIGSPFETKIYYDNFRLLAE